MRFGGKISSAIRNLSVGMLMKHKRRRAKKNGKIKNKNFFPRTVKNENYDTIYENRL